MEIYYWLGGITAMGLLFLMQHAGKIVTSAAIMRETWGPGMESETGFLRVYIANLRKKIERDSSHPELLCTEPAIGYRLKI